MRASELALTDIILIYNWIYALYMFSESTIAIGCQHIFCEVVRIENDARHLREHDDPCDDWPVVRRDRPGDARVPATDALWHGLRQLERSRDARTAADAARRLELQTRAEQSEARAAADRARAEVARFESLARSMRARVARAETGAVSDALDLRWVNKTLHKARRDLDTAERWVLAATARVERACNERAEADKVCANEAEAARNWRFADDAG